MNKNRKTHGAGRWIALSMLVVSAVTLSASEPAWWGARGVLDTNRVPQDFAAANQGQVKNLARQAYLEMESTLPGGAGASISSLVNGFTTQGNYYPVTLGQLKTAAMPFYDRLIYLGVYTNYPWSQNTEDDQDYGMSNIGQLKNVFSFDSASWQELWTDTDGDGLPDTWEELNGLDPNDSSDASTDLDGDGLSNLEEWKIGTDIHEHDIVNTVYYVKQVPSQEARGLNARHYVTIDKLRQKALEACRHKVGYLEFESDDITNNDPRKWYLSLNRNWDAQEKFTEYFISDGSLGFDYNYSFFRHCKTTLNINGEIINHDCNGQYDYNTKCGESGCITFTYDSHADYSAPVAPVVASYTRQQRSECSDAFETKTGSYNAWSSSCSFEPCYFTSYGPNQVISPTLRMYAHRIPQYNKCNDVACGPYQAHSVQEEQLSIEYTDSMHVDAVQSDIGRLGGMNSVAWGRMKYWASKDDLVPQERECEMGAMKDYSPKNAPAEQGHNQLILRDYTYQWCIPTVKGEVYQIVWWEKFVSETSGQFNYYTKKTVNILGTGGLECSPEYFIPAPESEGVRYPAPWEDVIELKFENAGQYSLTTAGFDDVTNDRQAWVSMERGGQLGTTRIKTRVTPADAYSLIRYCPPSIISINKDRPDGGIDHIALSGVGYGQSRLYGNLFNCTGSDIGKLGVAVYKNPSPITRFFVVTQQGGASPTDYPGDPAQEIRNRWRQAVATPLFSSFTHVTCDYDVNGNGWLEPDEQYLVSAACAAAINYVNHDQHPMEVWVFYVKKALYPGSNAAGWGSPEKREAVVRDLNGDNYSTAITTAHEWGHCMGAGHVQMNGTVMRDVGYTQGDFIPKINWDQVRRQ